MQETVEMDSVRYSEHHCRVNIISTTVATHFATGTSSLQDINRDHRFIIARKLQSCSNSYKETVRSPVP